MSGHVATYSPLQIPSPWEQVFLLGSRDLPDKKASLRDRVGWYKEVPGAGTFPAGFPDPSALKQAVLV